MQIRSRQIGVSRLALAIAMGAAIMALLASAAPARAEIADATDATAVTDAVAEASAPVDAGEAPAPPAPEPAPTPIAPPPVPVEAPEPVEVPEPVEEVPEQVSEPVVEVLEHAKAPEATNVSDVVNEVEKIPDAVPPPSEITDVSAASVTKKAASAVTKTAAPAREAVDLVTASGKAGLLRAPVVDQLAPASEATPPAAPGLVLKVLPTRVPSFGRPLLTGTSLSEHPTGGLESLLAQYTAEASGVEPLSLATARSPRSPKGTLSLTIPSRSAGSVQRSNGPAPLDDPGPLPRAPGVTVSGSGASFFVPIAALLALLALAAPATFRRRLEVPDFSAPTPFVCALERPG